MANHIGVLSRHFTARLEQIYLMFICRAESQAHTKFFPSDVRACAQLEFLCREKQLRERFRGLTSALNVAGARSTDQQAA